MSSLWADLRFAFRMMAKTPGYTAVLVVTLALGIGASTTIFSVVHSVLLRPLPYKDPDRLVRVYTEFPTQNLSQVAVVIVLAPDGHPVLRGVVRPGTAP